MKTSVIKLAAAGLLIFNALSAEAGIAVLETGKPLNNWSGEYEAKLDTQLVIHAQNGILDIHGSDAGATFKLTCAVAASGTTAECAGEGLTRGAQPLRFISRSKFESKPGNELVETWQVIGPGETREGITVYQRKAESRVSR